jgi:hypothetical protein
LKSARIITKDGIKDYAVLANEKRRNIGICGHHSRKTPTRLDNCRNVSNETFEKTSEFKQETSRTEPFYDKWEDH